MVESLRDLSKLCQKPNYKTEGNWYVRTILRDAALPVTWLLLHTRITANQVTLASLAVSFVAMLFLAVPGDVAFLAGVALLQFWYYLDHVDGQIARYRKTASLTGRFLDFMTHHIVHTALFFAMGFYGFALTGEIVFVVWGFIASLAILVFNLVHDVKYKTFFEKFQKEGGTIAKQGDSPSNALKGTVPLIKRVFSFLHKLCEIHVMTNVLTFAAFAQFFIKAVDLRMLLFIIYGVLTPFITIVKLFYVIKNKSIDQEYAQSFHFFA